MANASDGVRVLVDRLWPRGLRKTEARVDLWMKEVVPSPDLRKWFDHDPEKFTKFQQRYRLELARSEALGELRKLGSKRRVTLLYGARDPQINHAIALMEDAERITRLSESEARDRG